MDKDADAIRGTGRCQDQGGDPCQFQPPQPCDHDRVKYRCRNPIERHFNKLENWRRIATRHDKTADFYIGFVSLASALLWLPFVQVAQFTPSRF